MSIVICQRHRGTLVAILTGEAPIAALASQLVQNGGFLQIGLECRYSCGYLEAKKIIDSGADIVAFDGTLRKRPNDETLKDLINFIKSKNKLAMADIATFEEAQNAHKLGCDIVSTTLSGYTKETQDNPDEPDFELVKKIKKNLNVFTILEGKIWEKEDIKKAFEAGADAVVVGSAITRPQLIFKRLKEGLKNE